MPRGAKIITAAVLIVVGLASMGMIWLRDNSRRSEYCAECHVMEPYYSSWKSSDYLAHEHAKVAIPCQTCHARSIKDEMMEIVSNIAQDFEVPLKEQKFPTEDCFRCHADYAHLAELTRNLKDPDGNPLNRNPHDSHLGEMECHICHNMHRLSVDYCAICHGPTLTGPGWTTPE